MIDLGSIAGLHRHRHTLWCYCLRCDRWAEAGLERLVLAGWGSRRTPFHVRCEVCGDPGQAQVRPPQPTRPTQSGWMSPPHG
jgi:hypothetical protein